MNHQSMRMSIASATHGTARQLPAGLAALRPEVDLRARADLRHVACLFIQTHVLHTGANQQSPAS